MVGRAGLGPFHDENICDLADKVADWLISQKQRISRTGRAFWQCGEGEDGYLLVLFITLWLIKLDDQCQYQKL